MSRHECERGYDSNGVTLTCEGLRALRGKTLIISVDTTVPMNDGTDGEGIREELARMSTHLLCVHGTEPSCVPKDVPIGKRDGLVICLHAYKVWTQSNGNRTSSEAYLVAHIRFFASDSEGHGRPR